MAQIFFFLEGGGFKLRNSQDTKTMTQNRVSIKIHLRLLTSELRPSNDEIAIASYIGSNLLETGSRTKH